MLSAALVGLALGALLAGPIADSIGRRRVLIGSVFFFGLWTAACVAATDIWQLTVFRFLTGIGLGAALPNATTLLSEYVPAKTTRVATEHHVLWFYTGRLGGRTCRGRIDT